MKISIEDLTAKVLGLRPDEKIHIECVDGRQGGITFLKVFNRSMYVFSDLNSKFSSAYFDDPKDIRYWLIGCIGGEYVNIVYSKKELKELGWILIYSSKNRWCKKEDAFSYMFFDDDYGSPDDPILVDVRDYTIGHIEELMNAHGYTFMLDKKDTDFIFHQYGKDYLQIIAEYIFELDR